MSMGVDRVFVEPGRYEHPGELSAERQEAFMDSMRCKQQAARIRDAAMRLQREIVEEGDVLDRYENVVCKGSPDDLMESIIRNATDLADGAMA